MSLNSVVLQGRKATMKNVLLMVSLLFTLFILPGQLCAAVTLPPPSQPKTAFVRASNGQIYQIHYGGQGEFVDTFSVSLNGASLPRDVAAELYIAARLLNSTPYLETIEELQDLINPIFKDVANRQGWHEFAKQIGSMSVDLLIFLLSGKISLPNDISLPSGIGKILSQIRSVPVDPIDLLTNLTETLLKDLIEDALDIQILDDAEGFLSLLEALTGLDLLVEESEVLLEAYLVVSEFNVRRVILGKERFDLLTSAHQGEVISINDVKSAWKAFEQAADYTQYTSIIVHEYLLLPGTWHRLWDFTLTINPLTRLGHFLASTGDNIRELRYLEDLRNQLNEAGLLIGKRASTRVDALFDNSAIAAATAELENAGFFRNEAPQNVGSIDIRPLTVDGSAVTGDLSLYFSDPGNDRLTYSAESDNTRVARVSVSGSEITITPRGEGSARITVTATDPSGLTAMQKIDVTVQAESRCEYTLSHRSQDVLAGGGSLQVDVTTTSGCRWDATISRGGDFLSVSPSSGRGSGTVRVRVAENTRTRSRSGRLTIAGITFRVEQDGKRTIASQELSRGDAVIVQNTLNKGLYIRSGAGTNHSEIGGVFDGATGTITGGPRTANGYKWWKVDWDNNAPTGWSVEAIDEVLLIFRRPPDLAIERNSFEVSDSRLDPGEAFTLSLTVRNVGYNRSEEADLHYYHTSTRDLLSSDDLITVGTDTVRALDPGRSSNEDTRVNAPLTPGTYYYAAALIDPNADASFNDIVDSKIKVTVRSPTFPDLVVESPRVSEDTLAPGQNFSLAATVKNEGAGRSRSTTLRYYRSSDSTISTDDTQVGTDGVNALDRNDTDDESVTLAAPKQPGVYYYGACVDSVGNESDTGNNCSDGVRVTVKSPDLVVENVRVNTHILMTESSFTLSATVRNQSADSSDRTTLRYYRSTDSTISTDDTQVGMDGVSSLDSDDTDDESVSLTTPRQPGVYYYGVCVDSVKGESNTSNNCSRGIPVSVRVSLNQAPQAVGTIPAQTLTVGGSAANVNVSANFRDPDNDTLTYTASSDDTAVATVSTAGAVLTITPQGEGRATVTVTASDGTLTTTQDIPVAVEVSPRVVQTLVKISGDNQRGAPGKSLSNPLIVEVQDTENQGFEGVDVTFVVTAGGGALSATTATTDANGQAESWLTLGSQPGTSTVEVSVEGLAQTVTFNALVESQAFDLFVPSGISLIHIPLKVTNVDDVAQTIESIADLYDALGGADAINYLITYNPQTQKWLSYFAPSDRGTPADKELTVDMGIIASMKTPVSVYLTGAALGINGTSSITLTPGLNLVGLPLRDERINRVSDLLRLDGIWGNVSVITLSDGGKLKTVGRAGDPGDIEITGGQAFIMIAQRAAMIDISGEGWTNPPGTAAAPLMLTGIQVTDTTPVLALRGSIVDEGTSLKVSNFRVTVKNLSTGRAVTDLTKDEGTGYQFTVVDIETARAATIGDILEISAQSPHPFIGVEPLRYTVTAEDVKRSRIQLPKLVVYEIPTETELLRNYPNPFNPETWIPYQLAEDAFVTLTIYDGSGQVVRTLDVGHRIAAVYESRSKAIYWDGRNDVGEQVASGLYFYHLSAGDYSATRRMLILK